MVAEAPDPAPAPAPAPDPAPAPAPARSGTGPPSGEFPRGLVRSWRWVVPAVLLVVWLAVAGMGGGVKLSEVQKNDSSKYLPSAAESSRVAGLQQGFATVRSYPATILVISERGVTPQLRTDVQAFVDGIPTLAIPVEKSEPVKVGDFVVGGRSRVLPAEDGRALLAVVNFDLERLGTRLADGESAGQQAIEAIRRADRSLAGDGVRVYVAGPAAQIVTWSRPSAGSTGSCSWSPC